jgi:UDP-N-acetylglucosamine acyltransferase
MATVHPTAVISERARLGSDVSVGPFCVIEEGADIGDRCRLAARVVVKTDTVLGAENEVGEGTVLGGRPQHLRADGPVGKLVIGARNVFRENVTVHRGLTPDRTTIVGDANLVMVNAHIAHDCHLGSNIILANNVMLAGHVTIDSRAYLSGAVGVHQFCRIGRLAMVGGQSHITQDVPPFVTVDGRSSLIVGLNIIGLRRSGASNEDIQQLKEAYRLIYRSGYTWVETLAALERAYTDGPAAEFRPFLATTRRGMIQERRIPRRATIALPPPPQLDEETKREETPRVYRAG